MLFYQDTCPHTAITQYIQDDMRQFSQLVRDCTLRAVSFQTSSNPCAGSTLATGRVEIVLAPRTVSHADMACAMSATGIERLSWKRMEIITERSARE